MNLGSDGGRVCEPFAAHVLVSKLGMDTEGVPAFDDDDNGDDGDVIDGGVLRTAGLLFSHLLKALQTVELQTAISGSIVGLVFFASDRPILITTDTCA